VLDRLLATWVREAGWEPGPPSLEDGVRIPVRVPGQEAPVAEIVVAASPEGDATPCYARVPGFRLAYRIPGSAGSTTPPTARVLALLDAVAGRLRATASEAPDTLAIPQSPDALGTGDVLESSGGRKVEHLLRVDFHCNQACPFCFVRLGDGRLDPDRIGDLLPADVGDRSRETVVLTGGEPTLHPRLLAIVARLRELGFGTVSMQTNAVPLADVDRCRSLLEAGVRQFMVSFHAHRPDAYDRVTGTRDQYPRAVAGIRNLAALGADVTINVALTRLNVPRLEAHVRLIATLLSPRGGSVFFTLLNEYGHRKAPELAVDLRTAGAALDRAIPLCGDLGLSVEPFIGDCAPPPCCLADPAPVAPGFQGPADDVLYVAAPGTDVPPDRRVKANDCRACRFDAACRGVPSAHARMFGLDALRPV